MVARDGYRYPERSAHSVCRVCKREIQPGQLYLPHDDTRVTAGIPDPGPRHLGHAQRVYGVIRINGEQFG